MFTAALCIISPNWKQSQCLSTGAWISKGGRYSHTTEHYSAVEKEQTIDICDKTEESQRRYAKWKKPDVDDYIL